MSDYAGFSAQQSKSKLSFLRKWRAIKCIAKDMIWLTREKDGRDCAPWASVKRLKMIRVRRWNVCSWESCHSRGEPRTAALSQAPVSGTSRTRAPVDSDFGVFGKGKRVLHVDPKIAHRILDLAVAEKDLDSP